VSPSRARAPRRVFIDIARVLALLRRIYHNQMSSRVDPARRRVPIAPSRRPGHPIESSRRGYFFDDDRPNNPVNPLTTIPYVNPAPTAPTRKNAASALDPEYGPPIARLCRARRRGDQPRARGTTRAHDVCVHSAKSRAIRTKTTG